MAPASRLLTLPSIIQPMRVPAELGRGGLERKGLRGFVECDWKTAITKNVKHHIDVLQGQLLAFIARSRLLPENVEVKPEPVPSE